MANSERKILRGVRAGTKTYTSGMEDELLAALNADDAQRLIDKGHLQGDWSKAKADKAKVETDKK